MASTPRTTRESWQLTLLPLMSRMIVALTTFFFVVTLLQLGYVHWRIGLSTPVSFYGFFDPLLKYEDVSFEGMLAAKQLEATALLEASAMQQRYHQASVLLMSRVWVRYLGFVTGMILCLVGATFILGRMEEPESTISATKAEWGLALRTASPGIILALLGTVLIVSTIVTHHPIEVSDSALYTGGWFRPPSIGDVDAASIPPLRIPEAQDIRP
jgi:hypothetical protein